MRGAKSQSLKTALNCGQKVLRCGATYPRQVLRSSETNFQVSVLNAETPVRAASPLRAARRPEPTRLRNARIRVR
jgi:hypothetical protein